MRKVINEELNVKHNYISSIEKNDSEQYKNPVVSLNTNINVNKDTSSVISIVADTNLVALDNKVNKIDKTSRLPSNGDR